MKIVFRTDASVQIGTGHVMRCLTLADALRLNGAECTFICRAHVGHLLERVHQRGHKTIELPAQDALPIYASQTSLPHKAWLGTDWTTDAAETQHAIGRHTADWLVVDHYALDHYWEQALRPHCQQLMVIDDLADRVHDCDLLLDQNLGRNAEDYSDLTHATATKLIGPRYALLRPEFAVLRDESLTRRTHTQLKNLLITLGGVDKDNITGDVLNALRNCTLPQELRITVVMGTHAPWLEHVSLLAKSMPRPTEVLVNVTNMARVMTDSDLVISAAGGTAWELCSLGLPSIVIALAENQLRGACALQTEGAALKFENSNEINALIQPLLIPNSQSTLLQQLSKKSAAITQGNGAALVIKAMESLHA